MGKEITKRAVDALTADPSKDVFLWDGGLAGFGVRVRPSGSRYYFVKMRSGKRQRWLTIGKHGAPGPGGKSWTPETARQEALRLLGKRAEGRDPAAERDTLKENPTVRELGESFTEHVENKRKPRTADEYKRLLEKIVYPRLGKVQTVNLSRADVAGLHHSMRKTPYQANRTLALLSAMFTWGERRGVKLRAGNPARGVERYKEEKRRLFLKAPELARLGSTMREMLKDGSLEPQEAAAVRLLLFTGCRLGEILTLKWESVDEAAAVLHLPDSKTGSKDIHLNAPALAVLSGLPRLKSNPYVIPSPRLKGRHLINLEKPWLAIREKAGLPNVRLHDLRHAYGSVGAGAGLGLPIIGALLGHTQAATTQRYAHVQADPLKAAADAIGARLEEALDKQEGTA